jgi:predicted permease
VERADELAQHLEDRYQELLASGQNEDAAYHTSLDELKDEDFLARNLRRVETEFHREPIAPGKDSKTFFSGILQDIRYALRMLRRSPGFTAVAVLTLALGIGANTAIFSVVDSTILRPLPYPNPSRLMVLWGNVKRIHVERRGASYPDFGDWRDQNHSFEAIAAFDAYEFALTGIDTPERLSGEFVSQSYFSLLGVQPTLGRIFRPEEDQVAQRDGVVILSYAAWQSHFGGDPGIIGRTIQLDMRPCMVVGVAPAGFRGLSDHAELWVPFAMEGGEGDLNDRGTRWFAALARLKSGVSAEQAQSEMHTISAGLAHSYPATDQARGVEVASLERETFGDLRKPLRSLW